MSTRVSRRSLFGLVLLVIGVSLATQWWGARQEADVGRQLASLAGPGDILMVASDTCGPCMTARLWLQRNQVRYAECSIERDAACAQRFRDAGAPGTPLIYVRGQAQLGFVPQRVRDRLRAEG